MPVIFTESSFCCGHKIFCCGQKGFCIGQNSVDSALDSLKLLGILIPHDESSFISVKAKQCFDRHEMLTAELLRRYCMLGFNESFFTSRGFLKKI